MSLAQQLLDIKEEIENTKTEKAKIEGRLQELNSSLKDEWDIASVDEARKELTKFDKYIEKLESEMGDIADKLQDLGWEL